MTLNRQLAALRHTVGISQTQMAAMGNMYQTDISKFESGRENLTPRKLERLKRALRREVIRRRDRANELLKAVS